MASEIGCKKSNWPCPTHSKAQSALGHNESTSSARFSAFHVKVRLCCDFCRGSPIKSVPLVIRLAQEYPFVLFRSLGKSSFQWQADVIREQCHRNFL